MTSSRDSWQAFLLGVLFTSSLANVRTGIVYDLPSGAVVWAFIACGILAFSWRKFSRAKAQGGAK